MPGGESPTVINDAHSHFFSPALFDTLMEELVWAGMRRRGEPGAALRQTLAWEIGESAKALADRWAFELDRHGVAPLIASAPGDEASVPVAVKRHPSRFVGFFVLNPAAPDTTDGRRGTRGARPDQVLVAHQSSVARMASRCGVGEAPKARANLA